MKKCMARRLLPMMLALVLVVACMATTAFAEGESAAEFKKTFVIPEDTILQPVTFEYSIEAGTGVPASGSSPAILAPTAANGVTGTPTVAGVTFAASDFAGIAAEGGVKRCEKTVAMDFGGVTFSAPGIYRYILTETSSGQPGITYDSGRSEGAIEKVRILDVYVTRSGSDLVNDYVLHESGSATEAKSEGFVNTLETYDVTVSKTVTGNQASHDKYFKFTVSISGGIPNAEFDVTIPNAAPVQSSMTSYTAEVMAEANGYDADSERVGTQWVLGADGSLSRDVYLKHNDSIVICGVTAGADISVTEVPEEYTVANATQLADDISADVELEFVNSRDGIIPTGVLLSVIPGIMLIAVAGVGITAFSRKSKKHDEED